MAGTWRPLMSCLVLAGCFYIGMVAASPTRFRRAEAERSSKEQDRQEAQRHTTRTKRSCKR